MREQLKEIQQIERFILRSMTEGERLLMEAKMILSPLLKEKMLLQLQVYKIVKLFGRVQRKRELQAIHSQLMTEEAFSKTVDSIFK